ncbi:unnamed protein product [Closterium sp. NIES-53]
MGLVLGGRRPVVLTGHADTSWADDQATQRSSQGYTFSLGSSSVSWRSTRSSSVLSSSCEAEIYAGAMAAQELRWLTYLLTDLGEQPRSPPVLTKHIALRYFLARELKQRGQLRLAYVASEANTADIFTKALAPGDHQRFCTLLACFALLDWSCDLLFSPTLPMGVFLLVPNSFASSFIPVSSHARGAAGALGSGAARGQQWYAGQGLLAGSKCARGRGCSQAAVAHWAGAARGQKGRAGQGLLAGSRGARGRSFSRAAEARVTARQHARAGSASSCRAA